MSDQKQNHQKEPSNKGLETQKNETARSRWTPKPEQILILETIFNSGMVNPPKEETVKIRKHLEKFGTVGDANVFYWFQNRRSRSRRRQRLIQASINSEQTQSRIKSTGSTSNPKENNFVTGFAPAVAASIPLPSVRVGSLSSCGIDHDENLVYFGNYYHQQIIEEKSSDGGGSSIFPNLDSRNSLNLYGIITVIINGVATQLQRGPLDVRAMYGEDVMLYHSSGFPIAVNDYGIVLEPLKHGESYFLVPRQT